MIRVFLKSLSAIVLISLFACSKGNEYSPDKYFSKEEQSSLIRQSVLYSAKLAPQATHSTKYGPEFNWYYDVAAAEYDLRECYPLNDQSFYFLMTRKARSIWPAREAIGGKFTIDNSNQLKDYDEVFRTWKMAEDSLNNRAFLLFDLMVKGKDLTPYQSKFKGDRYIEFPDDRYTYDTLENKWKNATMDSLNVID